jgi:hypothetical protein
MNETPLSAKDCPCLQGRVDRNVNRFFGWGIAIIAAAVLLGQIARAAHIWPFA